MNNVKVEHMFVVYFLHMKLLIKTDPNQPPKKNYNQMKKSNKIQ